jgi:tRNA dimethylallyltransferase
MSVLISPPESLFTPPDEAWRKRAETMSVEQLQEHIQALSAEHWSKLNESEKHNRRRLTRLAEVLPFLERATPLPLVEMNEFSILLKETTLQDVESAIWQRVLQRWEDGAVEETKKLMELYPDWNFPAFTATGYKALREYVEGALTQDEAIEAWVRSERSYAKRQITWMRHVQKQNQVVLV